MYADDVVLMATSPEDLRRLVDAMQVFCAEVGLSINKAKSEVVTFQRQGSPAPPIGLDITVGGEPLEQVQTFKYLGVEFNYSKWLKEIGQSKAQAATRAVWALWQGAQTKK